MKRSLHYAWILLPALVWPTTDLWSAPSRFSGEINPEQSIAAEDETNDQAASVASLSPPAKAESVVDEKPQPVKAAQDDRPGNASPLNVDQTAATQAGQTGPLHQMTIAESLSEDESTPDDEQKAVGQDEIKWVGKDRRIKRVIKSHGTTFLKSRKPSGKLIITDDYHQSNTELLNTAEVRHYGARPDESKWLYSGSKFLCELRHPIPGFGSAVMKRGVEEPLQFLVEVDGLVAGSGQARVQSRPPIWKRFTLVKDLGTVLVEPKDKVLFSLGNEWVKRLLLELREGMQPTISFWDDDTGGEDVVLTVSSFNFQKHLPDFSKCLDNLLPYSFKDVRKRTVYFGYDKYNLSAAQTERLKKLIEYVKLDETVKKIAITGFSDSVGFARYNKILAQRRANAVKKYLLAQGVPASKLAVKARGEKGKKHSNRTASGRSKNRRVEVTLVK